jgi:hypothetical protein
LHCHTPDWPPKRPRLRHSGSRRRRRPPTFGSVRVLLVSRNASASRCSLQRIPVTGPCTPQASRYLFSRHRQDGVIILAACRRLNPRTAGLGTSHRSHGLRETTRSVPATDKHTRWWRVAIRLSVEPDSAPRCQTEDEAMPECASGATAGEEERRRAEVGWRLICTRDQASGSRRRSVGHLTSFSLLVDGIWLVLGGVVRQ